MNEIVNVLSAEQYFKKYAVDGIGKGADRWMIKRQLIDAFRKEIFGLITMRLKKQVNDANDIPEGDPEASRIAKNVIHDTTMKWKKLCGMFAMYKETAGLLDIKDLKLYDEIEETGAIQEAVEVEEEEEASEAGATEVDEYSAEVITEEETPPVVTSGYVDIQEAPAQEDNTREKHAE